LRERTIKPFALDVSAAFGEVVPFGVGIYDEAIAFTRFAQSQQLH
jgi:hypothetical protein